MTSPSPGWRDTGPEIVLDLSRLLSRSGSPTPTGVDRCEMAYARGLLAAVPDRLRFAAVHPCGYGRVPRDAAARFLDAVEERWTSGGHQSRRYRWRNVAHALAALRPRPLPRRPARVSRVYVQASHSNLTRPALVSRILAREQARFVCLVHDLIPLEYPEYARADGAAKHRARVATIAAHASGILGNSAATLRALRPHLARAARSPATAVAHLGTLPCPGRAGPAAACRPYFVCIGTIEPRKNHLLLLNLWRQMAAERGATALPELLLVGRRGWENEQIVDMLDRCPALKGCVTELSGLPDEAVQPILAGARGLLLPSFAEGYGMPVVEALACGVPVVCSDLPALREAGSDIPCYLDPLDGPGWRRAVEDLAGPSSRIAAAQEGIRRGWSPPTWARHIAILLDLLHKVAV